MHSHTIMDDDEHNAVNFLSFMHILHKLIASLLINYILKGSNAFISEKKFFHLTVTLLLGFFRSFLAISFFVST